MSNVFLYHTMWYVPLLRLAALRDFTKPFTGQIMERADFIEESLEKIKQESGLKCVTVFGLLRYCLGQVLFMRSELIDYIEVAADE